MSLPDGDTTIQMLQPQHNKVPQNTLKLTFKTLTIQSWPLLVRWIRLLFLCKVRMPPRMLCWWWHGLTGWTSRIHLRAGTSCSRGLLTSVNLLFHKPICPQYNCNHSMILRLLTKMVRPHSETEKYVVGRGWEVRTQWSTKITTQ